MKRNIIAALDTSDLKAALASIRRLSPYCDAFKIGHALTLAHGLDVLGQLNDAGAERIFLDLKFHDIPNSVAVAVREAARRGVWMLTVHSSGGSEMVKAAASEAKAGANPPIVLGVSVLTSLSEEELSAELAVQRTVAEQVVALSAMATQAGADGVVCSVHEAAAVRAAIGTEKKIVTPGIRAAGSASHDQARVADGKAALLAGADYLVIGRALTDAPDPEKALAELGLSCEPVS
jgi:orotidine-5'-phosphate decarboxylase